MQSEILALMNRQDEEDVLSSILFNLMAHCKQPLSEIMDMPLPLVWKLLDIIKKQNDEIEKNSRRKI
jgi:hypothetical protein